jgi:putative membrane protein
MADVRDIMAAERTLLAWIRTGIALMAFGFVIARFGLLVRELERAGDPGDAQRYESGVTGTLVVASGVVVNVWASLRHRTFIRRLKAGVADVSFVGPFAVGVATGLGGIVLIGVLIGAVLR